MKSSNFNEIQIKKILEEKENGKSVEEICFEYSISRATFYNWKKRFDEIKREHNKRLLELEKENYNLKRMFAELSLNHQILKERIKIG